MRLPNIVLFSALSLLAACSGGSGCDETQATNKLLALGAVQGRLISKGGESGQSLANQITTDAGAVSALVLYKKYDEACQKADEIEKKYGLNLANEMKDMVTVEDLAKDGGKSKGAGTCSLEDAAKKQMEIHQLLQDQVTAGKKSQDVFRQFGEDTKSFGELLTTDPSAACMMLDKVKQKYGL